VTQNSLNNSSSSLEIKAGASGDPQLVFDLNSIDEWTSGVDDTDSDKFKLSQGGTIGTNDTLSISAGGEVSFPKTPAFLSFGTQTSNVTGDGTTWTCVFGNEIFDQNSDFDGTSTFTAPIAGKYFFQATVGVGTPIGTLSYIWIIVSGIQVIGVENQPTNTQTGGTLWTNSMSILISMDAADTAYVQIYFGTGSKATDFGSLSSFSGSLEA